MTWTRGGATAGTGVDGHDGVTPHIGGNGNWFIGSTDTGIHAQGPPGDASGIDLTPFQTRAEKGQPAGYASLGDDGKVPAGQLPPSSGGGSGSIADGTGVQQFARWSPSAIGTNNALNTGGSWQPVEGGLLLPKSSKPMPRRRATKFDLCDNLTGTTGSATLDSSTLADPSHKGLGTGGSLKLVAPSSAGGSTQFVRSLAGAPWSFGDGHTPAAYLRVTLMIADNRDPVLSSLSTLNIALATAGGFTGGSAAYIETEIGKATSGETTVVRSEGKLTTVSFSMLDPTDGDMPAGGSPLKKWTVTGTFDWSAVTQIRLKMTGKNPAFGSYVAPTVWLMGVERVPLPPFALFTYQNDWNQPGHAASQSELFARYGLVPTLNLFPKSFIGQQTSTEMTVDQIMRAVNDRYVETSIYAVPEGWVPNDSTGSPVGGQNNFGGPAIPGQPGVPWSLRSKAQVEHDIGTAQAFFAEYNLSGYDRLFGQERKLRDADGADLLRKYASMSVVPTANHASAWWPMDDPYLHPTYMIDKTDFIDNGDGTFAPSDDLQRMVRRAVKNREWLRILAHAVDNPLSAALTTAMLRGLFDYATGAGRFDGTSGRLVSDSEALALTRYSS